MRGHRKLRHRISAAVCLLLAGTVCLTSSAGSALALTSLPHIEEIVSSVSKSGSFNILEIVPEAGTGSIGYYVSGQEPLQDLSSLLSGKNDQSERSSAAGEVLADLENRQLLGSGTDTPLTVNGTGYTEKKPWEMTSGDDSSMTELPLTNAEQAEVNGTFQSSDSGDYDKLMQLKSDGTGDQVQKIDSFQYVGSKPDPSQETCYYYSPTFIPVASEATLADGTAVYTNTANDGVNGTGGDPATGTYQYFGSWGSGNLTLDKSIPYYMVSITNQPYESWDPTHPYAAVSSDFTQTEAGQGYFGLVGYKYAGTGLGHYTFTPGGSTPVRIEYNTVWYSLGFQNNGWLIKYAFDQVTDEGGLTDAGSKMNVTVKSVTPSQVTSADVKNAQLIVLSAGFDRSSGNDCASSYNTGNDIDAEGTGGVYDAVVTASSEKTPIVLDNTLTSNAGISGTHIASLATALKGGSSEDNFVSGNLYCFSGSLSTKNFNQAFTDTTGFSDVLAEIENENFLRQKDDPDTTDLLPDEVTMANSVRYVINYAGQRQVGTKDKITVLDLEPGRGQTLDQDTVWNWLGGSDSGISSSDINIVTMSTSEFIGKIDDLVETYDMIYIGSDLTGFNTTGSGDSQTTVYNDANMDGLVYANVGDTYRVNVQLAGLLDRDYYQYSNGTYPTWNSGGTSYQYIDDTSGKSSNLFRFSGNDLTKSKADELTDFVKSGYPVVLADNLTSQAFSFRASVSASASSAGSGDAVTLTASVADASGDLPADRAYQWYKNGSVISGETNSTYSFTAGDAAAGSYSCKITIDGVTATSGTLTFSKSSQYIIQSSGSGTNGSFYSGHGNFSVSLSSNLANGQTSQQVNLTAATQSFYYYFPRGDKLDFAWYQQGNSTPLRTAQETIGFNQSSGSDTYSVTLGPSAVGTYTCKVNVDYYGSSTAVSNSVKIGVMYGCTGGGAGNEASFTSGSGLSINTSRVDSASYMYSALSSIAGYKNVMPASDAQADSETLRKYANLSKPQIEWVPTSDSNSPDGYPTGYSISTDADNHQVLNGLTAENGNYFLRYSFLIRNKTDATPKTTTYDCRLFLDLNSDGLYKSNEQITDLVIRDSDGHLISPVKSGDGTYRYELKADTAYNLTRQMPSDYSGIVPWKLEVVKNDNEYIHASQINYTHIAPANPNQIKILQINSVNYSNNSDTNPSYTLNLNSQQSWNTTQDSSHPYKATRTTASGTQTRYYHGLFGMLLYQVPDFDVSIDTVSATDLNNAADKETYLSQYNMLIIGFGDMYQELHQDAANAIVDFIHSGKSVLFTHDTTSLANVPSVYKQNNSFVSAGTGSSITSTYKPSFSDPAHWGYDFNTILRNAVKLDRYGIRSTDSRSFLETQKDGTNLTADQASKLTSEGYSVAYKPNSSRSDHQTVAETQGYTNYSLIRYSASSSQYKATNSSYSSGRTTTTVSQINKGQITTYPYNINTDYFENGTGNRYMTVSQTHEQYYQLNMNSDDIVVWYCLSNGTSSPSSNYYSALPNDVVNSYYIYNCGNITYSGMGHFTPSNTADACYTGGNTTYINEAELFVNTMIASYRASVEKPTATFTNDASGDGKIQNFFVTSDYSATTVNGVKSLVPSGNLVDADSRIYFKVTDPTLQKDSDDINVSFYYTLVDQNGNEELDGDGNVKKTSFTPAVYNADTGQSASFYSGGLVYDIQLPSAVTDALKDSGNSAVNLYVCVASGAAPTPDPTTDSKVQIRQIGLFSLG